MRPGKHFPPAKWIAHRPPAALATHLQPCDDMLHLAELRVVMKEALAKGRNLIAAMQKQYDLEEGTDDDR